MRKQKNYRIPNGPPPPPEVMAQSNNSLKGLSDEIDVQRNDGMPDRVIVISLLMSSVKMAAVTGCFAPKSMRHMFEAVMERYSEDSEDGT
jgi:hypothetical protein